MHIEKHSQELKNWSFTKTFFILNALENKKASQDLWHSSRKGLPHHRGIGLVPSGLWTAWNLYIFSNRCPAWWPGSRSIFPVYDSEAMWYSYSSARVHIFYTLVSLILKTNAWGLLPLEPLFANGRASPLLAAGPCPEDTKFPLVLLN